MYHFFVEPSQIGEKTILIRGTDVNHIKNVLRLKIGEEISISNGIDGRITAAVLKLLWSPR